jgi:hypothetical protein
MFVQCIQGKVADEAGLRRSLDRWRDELMPGATGYLGTTAGFTADGTFVALARFESADAARANSERPEQGAWWAETEKNFDGEVSFLDCEGVRTVLDGGSDDAGFVQIMRGQGSGEVARVQEQMAAHADEIRAARPEIIGGLLLDAGDGRWVNAFYFTSEKAAREGEQKQMSAELQAEMEEGRRLAGEPTFFDLSDPILVSPPSG